MKHFIYFILVCVLISSSLQVHCSIAAETYQAKKTEAAAKNWKPLFDGKSLSGWSLPVAGGGTVSVQEGCLTIGQGELMTGIRYEKEFPKVNYEIRYEAKRTDGYDFFAACTFPVGKEFCTFINGGWGGGVVGLSNLNGNDASENETTGYYEFQDNTWYRFRVNVTEHRIQAGITPTDKNGKWGTEEIVVNIELGEREVTTRMEVDAYKPLGFCTWSTAGQLRKIEYRTF